MGALSTDKQSKDLTTAVESATTVEGALGALSDNKQAKTLTTSVESQTTVEGALGALSTNKATQTSLNTEISARAELGAHNLLKLPYYDGWEKTQSGVTFRVNADGSVTVSTESGGATGETYFYLRYFQSSGTTSPTIREENPYIGKRVTLSGCPSDASTSKYYIRFSNVNPIEGNVNLTTEERTFDVTDRTSDNVTVALRIIILEGQIITTPITFYPMIRLASDTDTTYRPYVPTNAELLSYKDNEVLGVKNLLPIVFNTITSDNVTYTVNSNGSISTSGTSNETHYIGSASTFTLPKGIYILSTGNGNNYPQYRLYDLNNTLIAQGDNTTFTLVSDTTIKSRIYVVTGTYNNVVIYPMIRLASDTDPTYQPYAMTNRKLTENMIYSTSETLTNKVWIDGKSIYRKVYDFGSLPNSGTKNVAIGDDTIRFISLQGIAVSGRVAIPIPGDGSTSTITVYTSTTSVTIKTSTDMSAYTGYVIAEYTKTTD